MNAYREFREVLATLKALPAASRWDSEEEQKFRSKLYGRSKKLMFMIPRIWEIQDEEARAQAEKEWAAR